MEKGRDYYREMGKRIRERRLDLGLTQVECAAYLGIPQQSYSDYETGRKRARLDMVTDLADRLHTNPCWLAFNFGKKEGRK